MGNASNVEIVLLKQLSSCLAMPMFVLGAEGELVFFNEPAEPLLGRRFEETGMLGPDEWGAMLPTTNEAGEALRDEQRPVLAALRRREPTNGSFRVRGFDGHERRISGTAVPLIALDGRLLGALGLFWESRQAESSPSVAAPAAAALPSAARAREHAVETILTRRLASKLAVPIFLVDADGRLLYFNSAAEPILGQRFEEVSTTSRSREGLYAAFRPSHRDGTPMKPEEHPLWIARVTHQPVHRPTRIRGIDGVERVIEVTAIPLIGQSGRMLGACGLFWEGAALDARPEAVPEEEA